jgi:hypothetical protein
MKTVPQDTITFTLSADKLVISDTIKVIVQVNTLVPNDKSEELIRTDIKGALAKFIPTAEWSFSNLQRSSDTTGYERIYLQASARVSERENFKLEERAKQVSVHGLSLAKVQVDSTVPVYKLEKAEQELRLDIIKKAMTETKEICELTKRDYRVQAIEYQNQGDPTYRKSVGTMNAQTANTFYSSIGGAAPGAGPDDSLSNAQRVSLSAHIVLAVFAIEP